MPRAYVGTGGFATKSFSVANRPEESLLLLLLKAAQRAGNCYYFIAGRSEESLLLLLLEAARGRVTFTTLSQAVPKKACCYCYWKPPEGG